MRKVKALQQVLKKTLPSLDIDKIHIFVESGTVIATGGSSNSFEYEYYCSIIIEEYPYSPSIVMAALIAFFRINQIDNLDNEQFRRDAIKFDIDILNDDLIDLAVKVRLTERVLVTDKDHEIEIKHLSEPQEERITWSLEVDGEHWGREALEVHELTQRLETLCQHLSSDQLEQVKKEVGQVLQQSQRKRIMAQRNPDGSKYEKRSGFIRQRSKKMFVKLKAARRLKKRIVDTGVEIGFWGRDAGIARVHQFGEYSKIGRHTIKMPKRELVGLTNNDVDMIESIIMKHITE